MATIVDVSETVLHSPVETGRPRVRALDAWVMSSPSRAFDAQRAAAFQSRLMERVGSLPGVDAVAQAATIPLSPGRAQTMFRLPGDEHWHEIDINTVSPGYFSLIGIPILRGRTFEAAELADASRAVIITEATARRYWHGRDPIGRTLVMGLERNQEVSLAIMGVVKDAQVSRIAEMESSYMCCPRVRGPNVESVCSCEAGPISVRSRPMSAPSCESSTRASSCEWRGSKRTWISNERFHA